MQILETDFRRTEVTQMHLKTAIDALLKEASEMQLKIIYAFLLRLLK